jgi:hypothetical protein
MGHVWEDGVLRKIYGPMGDEVTGECMTNNFMVCSSHRILSG